MNNAFRIGPRICLRPLELEDLEFLQGMMNDPEIHPFFGRCQPLNRVEETEWIQGLHKQAGIHTFGIADRESGRLVGSCALRNIALPNRTADLGIGIGDAAFRGKGYGTEAMGLLLDYGFQTWNLHRIGLIVYANNPRAIRCYEKCGFRREGVLREARWWDGRWWDVFQYGILEHEWRERTLPKAAK